MQALSWFIYAGQFARQATINTFSALRVRDMAVALQLRQLALGDKVRHTPERHRHAMRLHAQWTHAWYGMSLSHGRPNRTRATPDTCLF